MANLGKTLNVRMDEEVMEQAKKIARQNGTTLSAWVRLLAEQITLTGGLPLKTTEELRAEVFLAELEKDLGGAIEQVNQGQIKNASEVFEKYGLHY